METFERLSGQYVDASNRDILGVAALVGNSKGEFSIEASDPTQSGRNTADVPQATFFTLIFVVSRRLVALRIP